MAVNCVPILLEYKILIVGRLCLHRRDCCSRLIALFLNKAFVLGPGAKGADQGALRDLGSLLHPLSVARTAVSAAGDPFEDQKVPFF